MKAKSIRTSLIILCSCIILVCCVVVYFITFAGMRTVIAESNKNYKEAVLDGYKDQIKGEVEAALTVVNMEYEKYQSSELTEDEAKQEALEIIRGMRYGENDEGYFWIDDTDYTLVMHPILPEQEGSNRYDLTDENGVKIIQNIVQSAQDGGGYNEFYFTKSDGKTVAPKLAYSQMFEPWSWIITTGNYVDSLENEIAANSSHMDGIKNSMVSGILIITAFLLAASIVASCIFANAMKKDVAKMQSMAGSMAKGDFTARVSLKSRNELGVLSHSLNDAQAGVKELVAGVGDTSEGLEEAEKRFVVNFEAMNTAIEKLTGAVENIAQNITKQSDFTSEAASGIEAIGNNIQSASADIEQLNDDANIVKECSERSVTSMDELLKVNEQTMSDIEVMYDQTADTNESVNKISSAATMISKIASQTNLLSLNASIEAARAGELGKGFAVVAGEIGELAVQSSHSVLEINKLIEELTENSNKSMDIMKNMNEKSKTQIETVSATQETFYELKEALERCMSAIGEIAESMQSINEQKDSIIHHIDNLNSISSSNAAAAQETSATAEEIEQAVTSSMDVLEEVKNDTEELMNHVSRFKVK